MTWTVSSSVCMFLLPEVIKFSFWGIFFLKARTSKPAIEKQIFPWAEALCACGKRFNPVQSPQTESKKTWFTSHSEYANMSLVSPSKPATGAEHPHAMFFEALHFIDCLSYISQMGYYANIFRGRSLRLLKQYLPSILVKFVAITVVFIFITVSSDWAPFVMPDQPYSFCIYLTEPGWKNC